MLVEAAIVMSAALYGPGYRDVVHAELAEEASGALHDLCRFFCAARAMSDP